MYVNSVPQDKFAAGASGGGRGRAVPPGGAGGCLPPALPAESLGEGVRWAVQGQDEGGCYGEGRENRVCLPPPPPPNCCMLHLFVSRELQGFTLII